MLMIGYLTYSLEQVIYILLYVYYVFLFDYDIMTSKLTNVSIVTILYEQRLLVPLKCLEIILVWI
jgi:hypothetical protein